MYELIKLCFDICFLKKGPEDIPVSGFLLGLLIPVYAGISFFLLILNSNFITTLLQIAVEIILILGATQLILWVAKKSARYQQTACALMATDGLISLLALPAMATLAGQGSGLALITIIGLMVWHWVVSGHIFSQALEQPFTFGLGVAFLYILVSYQVMGMIFPEVLVVD